MNKAIIGETCLLSYQLRRLGILEGKKDLFEDMLANLDGITELIRDNFEHILDSNHLEHKHYAYYPKHNIAYSKWVNNKYSLDNDNIFSWPLFAFFHYDTFNEDQLNSIRRKTERFKEKLESKEPLKMYYYYRYGNTFNLNLFLEKCRKFLDFLESKYNKEFHLVVITKEDSELRNVSFTQQGNLKHVRFASPCSWIGIDDNWNGGCDNDLFDSFKSVLV